MPRIYLLVQNNVRTGPFSLEELLQQPLHADGMIWIIGQSEEWLSPLAIPNLKPYYVQQQDGTITVKETVLADIHAKRFSEPLDLTNGGDHRYGVWDAQLLGESTEAETYDAGSFALGDTAFSPQANDTKASFPNESFRAERKATKAADFVNKVDDDNLAIARKNWAVVGLAALLILFITWNALFNDDARDKRQPSSTISSFTAKKEQLVDNSSFAGSALGEIQKMPTMAKELSVGESNSTQTPSPSTDVFLDSVQRVMDHQDQLMADVDKVYRKSFSYRKRYSSKQGASAASRNLKQSSLHKTAAIKPTATASNVPISQQVDLQSRLIMDKKKQINAVELIVKNNSKEVLKKVSVDVYYYKKGQKLLNKETVYFTNIYPKQLMTKSIAGNQRATSARSHLGEISTGKN
jgi:hypothetical protein